MESLSVELHVELFGGLLMYRFFFRPSCTVAFMLLTTLGLIHAQVPTSTLNGIVTDPQDAVISGARVTALSEAKSAHRKDWICAFRAQGYSTRSWPDYDAGCKAKCSKPRHDGECRRYVAEY